MPDEANQFKRLIHDLFRVRVNQPPDVDLRLIPGGAYPATLVLTLQDRPDLERALLTPDRGAILEVDMTWAVATKIYQQIWQLAQTMDLPLPKEGERQV